MTDRKPLILASASQSRARILESAGLEFETVPAAVDESEIKDAMRADGAPSESVAETLSEMKAVRISKRRLDAFVIGADQMLDCDGEWFDKPDSPSSARRQLQDLRGRPHELVTSACVAEQGRRIWHQTTRAKLWMRDFSDRFLDRYLDAIGDDAYLSVGVYQLEGRGAQLFDRIEGDYFTILGLPLLPLLTFLRSHGFIDE